MNAKSISFVFILASLLAACGSPPTIVTDAPSTQIPTAESQSTAVPPTDAPAAAPEPRLPADPQRVEFEAEDGTILVGYYYPASVEPAPVIVLMHWAGGTQCDWVAVNLVQWLQNRGLTDGVAANPACEGAKARVTPPFADYPNMPAGISYAVFTFDYRGYGESEDASDWDTKGYLKDSIAAAQKARTLDGVDPARVATIGASIGADGAINGCGDGCLGALSLSPGNYLGASYASAVSTLGAENKPAWCVASKQDGESYPKCEKTGGGFFQKFIYEENAHGMAFFEDRFDPKITQVIFDFLQAVFGG